MMRIANRVLDHHPINEQRRQKGKLPANGIWFWAEGSAILLPQFIDSFGKTGTVVSAVPLVKGIGALAGLSSVEVDGATGELDTNYEGKAQAVAAALAGDCDFAVLHVEAPDECTHNGDLPGKLQAIEWLDSRTLTPLLEGLNKNGEPFRLLILSDHKTLTETRGHDGDPVPYLLYDSRVDLGKEGTRYTEADCAKGRFEQEGHLLIRRLFEEAEQSNT
jgi:2,3-bisphosphoglycerate-independent phosphoglycerate mutase